MDSIKKDKKKNVVDDVKKRELLCIVGGNGTGAATIENYTEFPQEIENRTTIWSRNSTFGYFFWRKQKPLTWKDV